MPDFDFWLNVGKQYQIYKINFTLANFRVHRKSTTFSQSSVSLCNEPIEIVKSLINDIKTKNQKLEKKQFQKVFCLVCSCI